ncbi:MAG: 16S rRNA (adenine(1518)-N(6)/adenine(1519)-N(6))-dimethyltransferase RsmA [Actinomycetota bacterium]
MTVRRLTRTEIRRLLDDHGLSPSRALGQNFLCEPTTIDKIVRLAGVSPGDRVLEIGPGLGSLTVALADAGARVLAVEIDRYLIPALRSVVGDLDVEVLHADAMELDWSAHLGDDDWSVVANLPYNISTPLVLDLLAQQPQLQRFLVMVQREAGERLAASPGTKAYGIPSVLVAYWAEARIAGVVSAEVFLPRPKVESVLVEIVRHPTSPSEAGFDAIAELVRAGFGQRRKMLRRALADRVDADQFAAAGVDPTLRAEQLTLTDWDRLAVSVAGA